MFQRATRCLQLIKESSSGSSRFFRSLGDRLASEAAAASPSSFARGALPSSAPSAPNRGIFFFVFRRGGSGNQSTVRFGDFRPPKDYAYEPAWRDASGRAGGQEYQHFRGRGGGWRPGGPQFQRLAIFGALTIAGACLYYTTHLQTVPYTHRRQFIMINPQREVGLGEAVFRQIQREAAAQGALLPETHPAVRMVRKVGNRVREAALAGDGTGPIPHLQNANFEYAVIQSDMCNAFVAPGGKVCVFSGLIKICKGEDELAAVLAHETAHVVARHAAEKMSWLGVYQLFAIAFWLITGFGTGLLDLGAALMFALPNSREQETEADLIGLKIMARACYDPHAMETIFRSLGKAEQAMTRGQRVPAFLRTHPESESRSKRIHEELPGAYGTYEAAGCTAGGPGGGGASRQTLLDMATAAVGRRGAAAGHEGHVHGAGAEGEGVVVVEGWGDGSGEKDPWEAASGGKAQGAKGGSKWWS